MFTNKLQERSQQASYFHALATKVKIFCKTNSVESLGFQISWTISEETGHSGNYGKGLMESGWKNV